MKFSLDPFIALINILTDTQKKNRRNAEMNKQYDCVCRLILFSSHSSIYLSFYLFSWIANHILTFVNNYMYFLISKFLP